MWKRLIYIQLAVLGLLSVSANSSAAPFRYGEDRAPGIIHPTYATTMSEARLNELVFEGLFSDNRELRSTPNLAKNFTVARDGLSMTIQLKTGVQWHDGKPFTADDVVFSVHAYQSRKSGSPERGRVAWIETIEALGTHELRLTFATPEYAPQDKLHFKIIPKHLFDSVDLKRTHPFRNQPIGTGPFRVAGFNPDNSVTLRAFEGYHNRTQLTEVVMREVSDPNYQSKLLIYQSLEAIVRVLPKDIATLQNSRNISLYPYQTNSWWYAGFNLQDKRFKDDRFRAALHYYVDIEKLLAPIGTGEILSGPFVKSSPFYNHDVPGRFHNPEKADALMAQLGYTKVDRMWNKNGKPLTLRIATLKNLATAQEVLINLQSQLMSKGILLEPVFLTLPEWKQHIWRDRAFDMILSQWSFDRNENIYDQFHSKGARNFTSYVNPKVDEWLEQAKIAADPKEKKALLRSVHKAVHADNPMIFLWTLDSYAAVSTNVRDVSIHPFYFFTWAHDWTLQ